MNNKNMLSAYAAIMKSLGATFPVINPATPKKEHPSGRREDTTKHRSVSPKNYFFDGHGTIHRLAPKRDKSVSARQWKIKAKAARRDAK